MTLQRARGAPQRVLCQQFCQAVIAAQRRGELAIGPAAVLMEGALLVPGLEPDPVVVRLRAQTAALQSPLQAVAGEPITLWRELVHGIEHWTP